MGRLNIPKGALEREAQTVVANFGARILTTDPFTVRSQSWVGEIGDNLFVKASGSDTVVTTVYDARLNTWTQKANKPTGLRRAITSGTARTAGALWCFGGMTSTDTGTNNHEAYTLSSNAWVAEAASPQSTRWSCSTQISDTLFMSVCGVDDGTGTGHTRCYVYDTAANAWTQKAAHPAGGYNAGTAPWDRVTTKIAAGSLTSPPGEGPVREYDLASNTWGAALSINMDRGEAGWGRIPSDRRIFSKVSNQGYVQVGDIAGNIEYNGPTYEVASGWSQQSLLWSSHLGGFLVFQASNEVLIFYPPKSSNAPNPATDFKRRLIASI